MEQYKDHEIWKLCHQFTLDIYDLTSKFPKEELHSITYQLRTASSLIATNISEAISRDNLPEFNKFITIALGYAAESEYLILLSRDLKFINDATYQKFDNGIKTIKEKINSLKNKN